MCKKHYDRSTYDPNKKKQRDRRYYLKNTDKVKSATKAYRQSHPEQVINVVTWHMGHPDRVKEIKRRYAHSNKGKANHAAQQAKCRADLITSTPSWADLEAIKEFYKKRPAGYHVDHIYPLKGKEVQGLHVLENLQYLPAVENIRKSNKVCL